MRNGSRGLNLQMDLSSPEPNWTPSRHLAEWQVLNPSTDRYHNMDPVELEQFKMDLKITKVTGFWNRLTSEIILILNFESHHREINYFSSHELSYLTSLFLRF